MIYYFSIFYYFIIFNILKKGKEKEEIEKKENAD